MSDYGYGCACLNGMGMDGGHDIILDPAKRASALNWLRQRYKGKSLAGKSPYTIPVARKMHKKRRATVVPEVLQWLDGHSEHTYANAIRTAKHWKDWVSKARRMLALKRVWATKAERAATTKKKTASKKKTTTQKKKKKPTISWLESDVSDDDDEVLPPPPPSSEI